MKFIDEFRNPEIAAKISSEIRRIMPEKRLSIMEVCGGHTVAIFRYGIAGLLPENLRLISGPGCPVCVTPNDFIDAAHFISRQKGTIVATFGDMMRVPGSESSLQREKSSGADVRICYSPSEALEMAEANPTKRVVFLGIGFETTAPLVASVILTAEKRKVRNFSVLSGHKTMPFAMKVLLDSHETAIDGFICPGHVSAITGSEIFRFLSRDYLVPCAVSGFEPTDILDSIFLIVRQMSEGESRVELQYKRAVRPEGNLRAIEIIGRVFEPCDSVWRGLGSIA
ncbi:MAG: hydrogenase formation protein HypD, partial [Candidatus Marinimicrobia bacterium]|nr:hydrogenase formation protein HypD [Candidatus Neomarinimicrobiota bacterium]